METKNVNVRERLWHIQAELNAPKNQYNKFGNYSYRSCEDIFTAVKPLLVKHCCTLTVSDEVVLIGDRYYIKATATLKGADAQTAGQEIINTAYAREEETKKGLDSSQITGSCSSYARKYALNGLFLIDDVRDSDYTNTGEKEKKFQNQEVTDRRVLPFVDDFLFQHPEWKDKFFEKYKLKKLEDIDKLPPETVDIIITNMKKVIADEKEKHSIYGKEETF